VREIILYWIRCSILNRYVTSMMLLAAQLHPTIDIIEQKYFGAGPCSDEGGLFALCHRQCKTKCENHITNRMANNTSTGSTEEAISSG
jgi:hypothetical protein